MTDITKRLPDCDDEGERGERGEKGERGERGRRGHRGHDGKDGRDGHDGNDGATGPTGPASNGGRTGPEGPEGPEGPRGQDGATGPTGPCCTGATGPSEVVHDETLVGSGTPGDPLGVNTGPTYGLGPTIVGILQPEFTEEVITIYARSEGSDVTGDGMTDTTAYETFVRAVRDVPAIIPPGVRYIVDITGIDETLPNDYVLPAWKAPHFLEFTQLYPAPELLLFNTAVAIQADLNTVVLSPPSDAVITAGDLPVIAPLDNTGILTVTIPVARASWANNALKGKFLITAGTHVEHAVIAESTSTTLLITVGPPIVPTLPFVIKEPSAHLKGHANTSPGHIPASYRGAISALNCDSLAFNGIKITSTSGGTGLYATGSGLTCTQLCELQSPLVMSDHPFLSRVVRCWVYGVPELGTRIAFVQSLMDGASGGRLLSTATFALIARSIIQDSSPIEPVVFLPGNPNPVPASIPFVTVIGSIIRRGTGDGMIFHGGKGTLLNVNIYGCVGNGVKANLGNGVLELLNVATNGAPNGLFGVLVTDGQFVKVNAATSGSPTPLTGPGIGPLAQQIKVGILPNRTWLNFTTGADGLPIRNQFDLVGMNAGATDQSTGSRLYE